MDIVSWAGPYVSMLLLCAYKLSVVSAHQLATRTNRLIWSWPILVDDRGHSLVPLQFSCSLYAWTGMSLHYPRRPLIVMNIIVCYLLECRAVEASSRCIVSSFVALVFLCIFLLLCSTSTHVGRPLIQLHLMQFSRIFLSLLTYK